MASTLLQEFLIGIKIAFDQHAADQVKRAQDAAGKSARDLDAIHERAEKNERDRLRRRADAARQFTQSAVLRANLYAEAIEAAAKAVGRAVDSMASGFERLYYASHRTGASIDNLRGVAHAVGQLGGSYQGALASIEAFSAQMRQNPGYGALVRSLGVATEANGKLRDTTDILSDLGKVFAGKEYYIGFQYAKALGIDEETYRILRDQPEALKRYKEEYSRTARTIGLDSEYAAKNSVEFMQSLRSLGTVITTAAEKLVSDLQPGLKSVIDQFLAWVASNPDTVRRTIERIGEAAKAVGDLLRDLAVNGKTYFDAFLEKTSAWTKEGGVIDTFTKIATAIGSVISALERAITWFRELDRTLADSIGFKGLRGSLEFLGWLDKQTPSTNVPAVVRGLGALDRASPEVAPGLLKGQGENKGWWKRNMPTWLGGEPASDTGADTGLHKRARRAAAADKTNYNFTGDNATALKQAAKELGTSPEDLATVISYETGGKFSPSIWGGKGGRYMGLIQFGPEERATYGANEGQSFKEQLPAVVRYLKSRGFKPGMGLLDLYSTINAGRPGRYNASDGNGTVRSHVENMQRNHAARVKRFLESGNQPDYGKLSEGLGRYDFSQPGRAMQMPPIGGTSNDNSVRNSLSQSNKTEITVVGSNDPTATANAVANAQGGVNRMSLRNAQTAMR